MNNFLKSFTHAGRGILIFLKTTRNAWVHFIVAVVVIALGCFFRVSTTEWMMLVFACGLVFVAEALNTAIEIDINLTSPEYHPFARDTKDVAAGAVLIAAFVAIIIGCIVFIPHILSGRTAPVNSSIPTTTTTITSGTSTSVTSIAGSSYFGNEAHGDLNGDGIPDTAFILTQQGGGSGTFYYLVVVLGSKDGFVDTTNSIFLGDRIAPQTTEIKDDEVIVNYADRAPTDPMTTPPSIGVTKYVKVVGNQLVVVK